MEVGDFIIANGKVVKITRYEVECQGKTLLIDGKEPNIVIDDKVLNASGFVQTDKSASYLCRLQDDKGISSYTVSFNLLTYICEISTALNMMPDFTERIGVLSELQDFIRNKIGKELPINIEKLAAILK